MDRTDLTTKAEKAAWEFGAAAYANDEPRNPNRDYRSDIAYYSDEYKTWEEMPPETQQRLREVFRAGWNKERTYHNN